ncbi:MAG: hypothetical protein ACF8LK_02435 [Phycisphaerales bacterium JB041]
MHTLGTTLGIGLTALCFALGGCASPVDRPGHFTFARGDYTAAFGTTRDVLSAYRLELDRIDAEAGVISTAPEFSPGLLQPWSPLQTDLGDEWEDTLNHQARAVRVTFEPEGPESMRGSVWVTVLREQRAGRRLDSETVGGSTFTIDPQLRERHSSVYLVPVRRDPSLEARLAQRIEDDLRARLGQNSDAPEPDGAVEENHEPERAAPDETTAPEAPQQGP